MVYNYIMVNNDVERYLSIEYNILPAQRGYRDSLGFKETPDEGKEVEIVSILENGDNIIRDLTIDEVDEIRMLIEERI